MAMEGVVTVKRRQLSAVVAILLYCYFINGALASFPRAGVGMHSFPVYLGPWRSNHIKPGHSKQIQQYNSWGTVPGDQPESATRSVGMSLEFGPNPGAITSSSMAQQTPEASSGESYHPHQFHSYANSSSETQTQYLSSTVVSPVRGEDSVAAQLPTPSLALGLPPDSDLAGSSTMTAAPIDIEIVGQQNAPLTLVPCEVIEEDL